MSQVPPDLNDTMWQIAERGDAQAAAEFSERFPALARAMNDRMRMVGGMKSMRSAIAPSFVPGFTPRYLSKPKPKWMRFGPSALGLAALAAASFYITQNMLTPLPDPATLVPLSARAASPIQPRTAPEPQLPSKPFDNPAEDSPRPYVRPSAEHDESPQELKMDNVPLLTAFNVVAKHWKLKLELPPNFPNPTVKHIDVTGSSGMDFLKQIAEDNGCTAFYEGNNKALILPAPDEAASTGQ